MKTTYTRTMGILRIFVSLAWVVLCVLGIIYGARAYRGAQNWLDEKLSPVADNLNTIQDILVETTEVLSAVDESLTTVHQTTVNTSQTLSDAQPVLDDFSQVITNDVPEALDGVQSSMPSVIETAGAVDETLLFLSAFKMTIPNPLGRQDYQIGLGIDYAPEVPLDEALEDLSNNLEEVPDDLRAMEEDLETTSGNLQTLSDDLLTLADDLDKINQQLIDLQPQVDDLVENIHTIQADLKNTQDRYTSMLPKIRFVYMAFLSLLLVTQVPSAYMGWMLIKGNLSENDSESVG